MIVDSLLLVVGVCVSLVDLDDGEALLVVVYVVVSIVELDDGGV